MTAASHPYLAQIVLLDSTTASTLAQVLPVLLLTIAVEMRRIEIHLRMPRVWLSAFFLLFAVVETVLVLSIDGQFYPFHWFDLISALLIFGLLSMVFMLSLADVRESPQPIKDDGADFTS